MTSLFERLNDNEIILLDGGVSTEIQKRGVAMDSDVWSGLAHKSHPEIVRSEEHTSELQSLVNLVCRLLLEKKTNKRDCQTMMICCIL